MSNYKYTEDDYCDLIPNKICDNCGKCLEEAGVDIRAIKIEDIAKNVDENKFIEEELKKAMDSALDLHLEANEEEYSVKLGDYLEDDYVDAFENIVYLDDIGLDEEESLEDTTVELYPGLRAVSLKNKNK